MKLWLNALLMIYACSACNALVAKTSLYDVIDPAQEKVRVLMTQINATFTWIDPIYAARERFYLSKISLEFIGKLKRKYTSNKEGCGMLDQLEMLVKELHRLDLRKQDFEILQCKAQKLISVS